MDIGNLKNLGSIAAACLLLAACGGSGGGGDSDAEGRLSLSITDAPIYHAQLVEIDVTGVEVKPESGPALMFSICEDPLDATNPPVVVEGECSASPADILTIDLLQYTNGASFLLLDEVVLPAGRVNWVRLRLTDPAGRIMLPGGGVEPLTVPSGNQTGLKLNRGFDVVAGEDNDVTIDFDVRKSIVEAPPGEFKLKPSLRLVEDFGAIAGTVDASLLVPECLGPSIYVFEGDTTPDDIDRDKGDPVSSTMVSETPNPDGTNYRAGFLEPGEYTVAFVCAEGVSNDGGMTFIEPAEDPDQDDALSFTPPVGKAATVIVDATFPLDFP